MIRIQLLLLIMLTPCCILGQGAILSAMNEGNNEFPFVPVCGSHDLIKSKQLNGLNEQLINDIQHLVSIKSNTRSSIYRIPVVFHIVHNNPSENIPDSILLNQLDILNQSFRRTNEDTTNTRAEFLPFVGDTGIEFYLAETDPSGFATSGITRTNTSIEYFGGIIPFSVGQNAEIGQWIEDSLFYNYFRLTNSSLGGKDPWDTDLYLNVWIGDLRIYEPQNDGLEEIFYFALATPPMNDVIWPEEALNLTAQYSQGVLLHYVCAGSNNPNLFPPPYTFYNGVAKSGKLLAHEVGHFLGIRHIWGDGNCDFDDFIDDTPKCSASSAWNCNFSANTCVDDIGGEDLPNMVENYMDYSSGDCQNSFTIGQGDLMRNSLEFYYPNLYDQISGIQEGIQNSLNTSVYPNPTSEILFIDSELNFESIQIFNSTGQVVKSYSPGVKSIPTFDIPSGVYVIKLISTVNTVTQRFIKK